MSILKLEPPAHELFSMIEPTISLIKSGGRIRIVIPREVSHLPGDEYINWDNIEEVQMMCRGSCLEDNVFVTLRFDQKDESSDVVIDILRL